MIRYKMIIKADQISRTRGSAWLRRPPARGPRPCPWAWIAGQYASGTDYELAAAPTLPGDLTWTHYRTREAPHRGLAFGSYRSA